MNIVQFRTAEPELDPRVYKFSSSFRHANWSPVVVFWRRSIVHPVVRSEAIAGLTTPNSLRNPPFLLMPFFLILFYLRSLPFVIKLRPRICVAHQLDTLPLALILRKLIPEVRVVFDREDIYSLMVYPNVPNFIYRTIDTLERNLSSRADLWIFPNEGTRDYASDGSRVDSIIVPNVPESSFRSLKRVLPSGEIGYDRHFRLAYLGTVNPHLGVDVLIRAIGKLLKDGEEVEGVIIGDGDYLCEAKLLSSQLQTSGLVRFIGRVERKMVPEIMSTCDASAVLVTPTSPLMWLVAPNKLFESMIMGIPVIASNFGTLAQIVDRAKCGILVNPNDIESVVAAIRLLSKDRGLYMRLSTNGVKAMETSYSWDKVETSLIGALTQLASTRDSQGD